MPDAPRYSSVPAIGRAPAGGPSQVAQIALQAAVIRAQSALLARQAKSLRSADAGVGLWSCRLRDDALDWSGGVYDIYGIPRGARLHRPRILELIEPASRNLLELVRSRAIEACTGFGLDVEIVTPGGARRWLRIRASVETGNGRAVRIFGTHQDATAEIERLAEVSRRAELDALTGLANRRAFDERLHGSWTARCREVAPGALALIDLDGFKLVNDVHGHAAGDACIRQAAARLALVSRDADLVARIGGDEFAVLLPPPAVPAGLATFGRDIVQSLGRPFEHRGASIRVGASVGIARTGAGGPDDLFARADAALYAAKAAGRNAVRIDGGA